MANTQADIDKLPETKVGQPKAPSRPKKGVTMQPEGTPQDPSQLEVPTVLVNPGVKPGSENEVTLKVQTDGGKVDITTKRVNH